MHWQLKSLIFDKEIGFGSFWSRNKFGNYRNKHRPWNDPDHGSEPLNSPAPVGQSAGVGRVEAEKMYARALDLNRTSSFRTARTDKWIETRVSTSKSINLDSEKVINIKQRIIMYQVVSNASGGRGAQ